MDYKRKRKAAGEEIKGGGREQGNRSRGWIRSPLVGA